METYQTNQTYHTLRKLVPIASAAAIVTGLASLLQPPQVTRTKTEGTKAESVYLPICPNSPPRTRQQGDFITPFCWITQKEFPFPQGARWEYEGKPNRNPMGDVPSIRQR